MMVVSCNNGTLSTFVPSAENPWDISKILLVNRRLGFGIKHMDIKSKLSYDNKKLRRERFLDYHFISFRYRVSRGRSRQN